MKQFVLGLMAAAMMCTPSVAQNRVKNIYAQSSTLNVAMMQQADQPVQLNRYLYAGYNTLCLPMSLTAEQLATSAKDVQIERLAAVRQEGNVLYLYFLDCTNEGVEAGVPYLIYSPTEQYLRAKNTDAASVSTKLKTVRMSDDKGNTVSFNSNWKSVLADGRYGIPAQQDVYPLQSVLIRTSADKAFLPTRCGFVWEQQSSTATKLEIKHMTSLSDVTAINALQAADAVIDVYDLKGNLIQQHTTRAQAQKSLPRGLYVIGGEKVAVK